MADPKYANLPGIVSFRWNFIYFRALRMLIVSCYISALKYCILMAFEFPQHANSSIIHKPCCKLQYQGICLQSCKNEDIYSQLNAHVILIYD